jgi:HAD superfamily hydrolase (TIGR01509 family)
MDGQAAAPAAVSGIVFDCDGLLLDTEQCWSRAQTALFARHGRPFGDADKARLIGRTVATVCGILADELNMPGRADRIEAELLHLVEIEFDHLKPMPGTIELLDALAGRVPIAVATNSTREMLDNSLDRAGIHKYFDASVAVDEVARPKPHPDVYLAAFDKLGAAPETGVAFEDSSTGSAAARAAGTFVITVASLPGALMSSDLELGSLTDAGLLRWAHSVQRQQHVIASNGA